MAKHCTNCGHELRGDDTFCAECGTSVGGTAPQSQPVRQGQWEYRTFTEGLVGGIFTGPIESIDWPFDGGAPRVDSEDVDGFIQRVVNQLVVRVSFEGWEPDESTNASSLWREQHVKWEYKGELFSWRLTLTSVSVRFKRSVTP
jgi:hypothetical protein